MFSSQNHAKTKSVTCWSANVTLRSLDIAFSLLRGGGASRVVAAVQLARPQGVWRASWLVKRERHGSMWQVDGCVACRMLLAWLWVGACKLAYT